MPRKRGKIPHKSDTRDSLKKTFLAANLHSMDIEQATSLFMAMSPHTFRPKTSPHAVSHFDFPETVLGVDIMSVATAGGLKKK